MRAALADLDSLAVSLSSHAASDMPADARHKNVLTASLHRTARKLGKTVNQWIGVNAAV